MATRGRGGGRGNHGGGGGGGRGGAAPLHPPSPPPPPGAVYGTVDSLGNTISNYPPTVTQQLLDESIDRITNPTDLTMQAYYTQFNALAAGISGPRHLYIWPNLPTPTRHDPNDSREFWGLGGAQRAGGSHVHIIIDDSGGQLEVKNGIMTVNLGTPGAQEGTEYWHLKIQYPPIQPRDVQRLDTYLAGYGRSVSNELLHPTGNPENQWVPFENFYMAPDRMHADGVRRLMNDRILMDAVQYHIAHDSSLLQEQWKTLVQPGQRKWSQKGQKYRDQWQGLMKAVSRMGTHWWQDPAHPDRPYAFPVKDMGQERPTWWTRGVWAETAPRRQLNPLPVAAPAPAPTHDEMFPPLTR